ncbi:MAG TPA: hypothetical protein DEP84_13970, partial [Chloroflexi bacterium]|nr:hypothetical protein [Chloroflexota bacterium]
MTIQAERRRALVLLPPFRADRQICRLRWFLSGLDLTIQAEQRRALVLLPPLRADRQIRRLRWFLSGLDLTIQAERRRALVLLPPLRADRQIRRLRWFLSGLDLTIQAEQRRALVLLSPLRADRQIRRLRWSLSGLDLTIQAEQRRALVLLPPLRADRQICRLRWSLSGLDVAIQAEQLRSYDSTMIDFFPDIAERTRDFTGREWVFAAIDEWLARPDGARSFVVTGEPGSGKTAVATRLAQFSQGSVPPPPGLSALAPGFLSAIHFCRFQDQRQIDPFVFTESLATQLGNRYPAYRERVEQIPSGPQVQIQITQQVQTAEDGSQIIGLIYRVSGASAAEAFIRMVREPLEALLKEGHLDRVTILVDSLDEALLHAGLVNIVDLLSRQEGLPEGVRFIVTIRPDEKTMDRLGQYWHQPAVLSLTARDGLAASRHDIERYVEQVLTSRAEARVKLAPQLRADTFASTVAEKSDGNFLYAHHLLSMLAAQREAITEQTLEAFPDGLDRLYLEFLDRLFGDDPAVWTAKHAPVIGTLAVAREVLSEEQLADFVGVEPDQLRPTLEALAHFLEADRSRPPSQRRYTIYHSSFASFLLDPDRAARYWCREAGQHQRITGFYARRWGGLERGLPGLASPKARKLHDGYPFRSLSTHLRLGGEHEKLFALVEADAWYEAQMTADPSAATFLRDLTQAWQATEEINAEWLEETDGDAEARQHPEWTQGLGREVRYAVATATLHSLSGKLPAALLVALATTGEWTAPQVLTAVSQIPTVWDRFETLIQLADSTAPLPKVEMLREALTLARTMPERSDLGSSPRRLALEELARVSIKVGSGAEAPDAVTSTGTTAVQARVLAEIAPLLGASGQHAALLRALEIARSFGTDSDRTTALAAVGPQLARVGDPQRALDAWQEIVDGGPWTETAGARQRALVDLAQYLPDAWLPQAETAAQTLPGEAGRVSALSWIAPRLPEPARSRIISQVLEAIERMAADEAAAEAADAVLDEPATPLHRLLRRSGAPDSAFRGRVLARL